MDEEKKEQRKRFMARLALVLMAVFIIGACVCMVIGNKELMMAALFCIVFVPIILYCFILVYDMTYGKSKRERESALRDGDAAGDEAEGENETDGENKKI